MPTEQGYVNYYEAHGLHLIRISKTGIEAGKRPLDTGWQNNPISYTAARAWASTGGNLGWAVGPNYLVVDVDPRDGGDESFSTLLNDSGVTAEGLLAVAPHVITGSGGRHLYFKVDSDIGIKQGPLDKEKYPGIDIKTGAGQVVIPGSTHPSGLPYLPDTRSAWGKAPAPLPAGLLSIIASLRSSNRTAPAASVPAVNSAEYGCLSVEECEALVAHLDPQNYQDYDQWIRHIAGIHHATGGKGLQVAIDWSARDALYADQAARQVSRRWRAFARPRAFPSTVHTLLASLPGNPSAQAAGQRVRMKLARADFDQEGNICAELEDRIDSLPGGGWEANQIEAENILAESMALDLVTQDHILSKLAKELGVRKTLLNGVVAQISRYQKKKEKQIEEQNKKLAKKRKKEEKEKEKETEVTFADFIIQVQERVFEKIRAKGQCIARAPNEQYYLYKKTHWQKVGREHVCNLAHKAAQELSEANEKIDFEITGVTDRVEKYIRAQNFVESSQLYFTEEPLSVVNAQNGTVWIDSDTGDHEFKAHNPGDYLTTCIPVSYDKEATCPSFDTMLEQVFEHIPEDQRADVIRHWWEVVGYVIQPNKNIPLVLFWKGDGFNGKSTICNFLQALLGKGCALPTKLHEFGSARNQHSTASLEGKLLLVDDDLQSDAKLSDGVLKKFSESKLVEINPKHHAAYTTRSNLTPLILTNGWPVIRDLSPGLQRRFDVIPFTSDLAPHSDSPLPQIARKNEMPGILNGALAGLKRLRQRKRFDPPRVLLAAKKQFFEETNNVAAFLKSNTEPGGSCDLGLLYSSYVHFCVVKGERNQIERFGRFRAMILQLGYTVIGERVDGIQSEGAEDGL